jgi:RES domain-containing protein
MRIYRLNHKKHKDTPLSGKGAAMFPGRWNLSGVPALYCSASAALAVLEMLVNVPSTKLLLAKSVFDLVIIEIDDQKIKNIQSDQLPPDWNNFAPLPRSTQELGSHFFRDEKVLAISVPSAVSPQDRNIVINPDHPEFNTKCRIISQETFIPESRLSKLLDKE